MKRIPQQSGAGAAYAAPLLETMDIRAERGFAASTPVDYDGEENTERPGYDNDPDYF